MDYRKRKINPIIILSILFLFQKSFGSNYLKDISFYGKENGLIVEFVFEKEVSPDSVNAWQSQTEWFYFTLYNVLADTLELLVQTEISKPVLNFQPILTEQSTQIGIKLKNRVESFEIYRTSENNILNAHLHYPIENFAELSSVTTYKAAVRTKSNTMCTAIDNASDVEALAALYVYNSDDPPVRPLGEFPSEPS